MSLRPIYIIVILLLVSVGSSLSQTAEIEKQRGVIATLEKQVAQGERAVDSLRKSRAANEVRVRTLANQVATRNRLLVAQRTEESSLRAEIALADKTTTQLAKDLEVEKQYYAQMVREAYRSYNNHNVLTYIFTATDFQDMARKISNLRAVGELRERRIARVDSLSKELTIRRADLLERKGELEKVVKDLTTQKNRLQSDVNSARRSISDMSSKERKVLQQRELQQRQLDAAITELQKLIKGNKAGASFSAKTSNLRLPVVGGRVKQYKENMAEILGPAGASIISIYEGKVVDVRRNRITGKYDVYVAHGEYITSYAGLSSVSVAKDDTVSRDGKIGVIGEAVDIITMQSEYKIVFGIYPPNAGEKISAASCFKK